MSESRQERLDEYYTRSVRALAEMLVDLEDEVDKLHAQIAKSQGLSVAEYHAKRLAASITRGLRKRGQG